jgi:beta-glucosidase
MPRFPFGFGLSYTTFRFSGLKLSRSTASAGDPVTASFTVTNSGAVAGATVAQLYVGEHSPSVPRPAYELKGFAKVSLKAGESRTIHLPLDRRAFAFWSTPEHGWKVDPGRYTVYIGDSSADLPLREDLTLR